ncbi:HPP family protein [Sphingomonas sp. A2-49]|uniref:HPP family protein n=1 Tax=Sphingomonas sp. A2-49 TaxID=1391375 RepID=UPI0021D19B79|nr:HPP family protein [Sphingomonas sp. A2-49]MCU6455913.1 HPP family protein [Sphingomonas sp. A2-49]
MHIVRFIHAGDGRIVAGLGAALGIAVTGLLAGWLTGQGTTPLLIAPIGASAVLVFAVPASPLAQPWPVIGGNMLSALFALLVVRLVPHEAAAAAIAVGGAIVLMALARCLHPPGGAVALGGVLLGHGGGPAGWSFPVVPVGLDSLLLVVAGVAFHRWSGHGYPHRPPPSPSESAFAPGDVDAALADMHETFDIARADLDALLARAAHHAALRRERSGRSSPLR